jgi:hypothetical protein
VIAFTWLLRPYTKGFRSPMAPAIHDCVWCKIPFPKVPSILRAQFLARCCFVHSAAATYLKNVPTQRREARRSESMYSMVNLARTPMFCAVCMVAGWESSHRMEDAAVLNQHSGKPATSMRRLPKIAAYLPRPTFLFQQHEIRTYNDNPNTVLNAGRLREPHATPLFRWRGNSRCFL